MTETQNSAADGSAGGVPNGVPGQNAFRISRQRPPAQAATAVQRWLDHNQITVRRDERRGDRRRILVDYQGRRLAVSYTAGEAFSRRSTVTHKLRRALMERGV